MARARRLVVSCIATVGNYEYGFYWYLGQDGTIGFEAKLTGVLHTAGVPEGEPGPHATEIAPGVAASVHQHFFCARLDMDVDGTKNTVVEIDALSEPRTPRNPDGSAFSTDRRVLDRESQARRSVHSAAARRWRVESAERRNRVGEPTAYELIPGEGIEPMALPDSEFRRRARFLDHHLWVTPFAADERYPAGEYPNQSPGGDGLERWTKADRPLEGEDVVLWYTFGSHHVPRLEDWPVMPVVRCGFELRPVGFFDRNPALDVPPPARALSSLVAPADCGHLREPKQVGQVARQDAARPRPLVAPDRDVARERRGGAAVVGPGAGVLEVARHAVLRVQVVGVGTAVEAVRRRAGR